VDTKTVEQAAAILAEKYGPTAESVRVELEQQFNERIANASGNSKRRERQRRKVHLHDMSNAEKAAKEGMAAYQRTMIETIYQAATRGELILRHPHTDLPYLPKIHTPYVDRVKLEDVFAWIKSAGLKAGSASNEAALVAQVWERADIEYSRMVSERKPPKTAEILKGIERHLAAKGVKGRGNKPITVPNIKRRLKGWQKSRGHKFT
jgi:hypothetical protein